jgi:hypothetical protein
MSIIKCHFCHAVGHIKPNCREWLALTQSEQYQHSVRVTTRKISYNRNQKTVQTKGTLSLRSQTSSSFLIPHLRNPDTTMSNMHTLDVVTTSGTTTATMVQGELNTATTAETDTTMDVDGVTTDEEESQVNDNDFIDYNEEGITIATEAATRVAYLTYLRELFTDKRKEYRAFLKSEKVKDLYTSPMTVEMSSEEILSEIPIEDLHSVGVVKGLLIMPPSFVQKHILPAIKVRKALKQSGIGEVRGGIETAILFSLYDQSVMDFNKSTGENLAENSAVRAMVNQTKNDTIDHFTLMKEGRNNGQNKGTKVKSLR